MGQILAVDFGKKRCGLAATDDLRIIASGLDTVETTALMEFLRNYFSENSVDEVVIGLPTDLKGNMSEVEQDIQKFIEEFKNEFPEVSVVRFDERFTSKKQRQEKGLIDKVSATLILQQYLEQKL